MDRVCAAYARKPGGHLQEERSRRDDQEDSAEGPASGHCVRRRPVRSDHRRNLDFLECQWCCDQADIPARQELRRRWHGNAKRCRIDQGSEGQDDRRVHTRHRPLFHPGLDAQEKGLSVKDVTVVNLEPAAAAQAFVSGQNDAAMTYEPYLSTVRAAPDKGKIIATTLDYPMIMDTFGCTPKFLTDNPKAAKALADSYFEAVAMIEKDQAKSYEIMGADVKQSGEQFGNSAKYLRWQDKAANQKFFAGEFLAFNKEAAELLLEVGIIKEIPKIDDLYDASFIK